MDFRMYCYHGSRQRGAMGACLVAYLSNPFNYVEMRLDEISKSIAKIDKQIEKLKSRKQVSYNRISEAESKKVELMNEAYNEPCPLNRVCQCGGSCAYVKKAVEGTLHLK